MFLLVRTCAVLLVNYDRQYIMGAPYVDDNGERDMDLVNNTSKT